MKKVYFTLMTLLSTFAIGYSQCSVSVTGSTNVTCNGLCDGSVTLASVGVPNFTYIWSPGGQTVQNPSDLCAGTHTVTMMDANSCVATTSVVITEPDPLQDSSTVTDVSCNGDCNGSIDLHPYGGTFPYSYVWSPNGETTEDLLAQCAGTYSVLITDANNCTDQDVIIIGEPGVLAVGVTAFLGCGSACDKSATATPTGGTAPYSYVWTPSGQTTQTATGLCAGTHQVNVLDTNGCSANGVITITNPADLVVSTSATDASCWNCPDGSTTASASGGTAFYNYSWSPGGCTLSTCSGLMPGTYEVTVTDANGCTDTASQVVSSPVAINESDILNDILIYPNPFSANFSIELNLASVSVIGLNITNVVGEYVYSEMVTTHHLMKNLSLQYLDAGIYFLNLEVDGILYTKKIIKE